MCSEVDRNNLGAHREHSRSTQGAGRRYVLATSLPTIRVSALHETEQVVSRAPPCCHDVRGLFRQVPLIGTRRFSVFGHRISPFRTLFPMHPDFRIHPFWPLPTRKTPYKPIIRHPVNVTAALIPPIIRSGMLQSILAATNHRRTIQGPIALLRYKPSIASQLYQKVPLSNRWTQMAAD